MPSFFSRLFRRKPVTEPEPQTKTQQRRGRTAKKETKKQVTSTKEIARKNSATLALGPKDEEDGLLRRNPSFTATTTSGRESSIVSRQESTTTYSPTKNNAPSTSSRKVPNKVLSPRNTVSPTGSRPKTTPVDLDDTDFEESDHDENRDRSNLTDAGLSFQRLHQFNMQHQPHTAQQLYEMNDSRPVTKNAARISNRAAAVMDDMNDNSESSLSEFNLSTDAEDEEYNAMKKKVAGF